MFNKVGSCFGGKSILRKVLNCPGSIVCIKNIRNFSERGEERVSGRLDGLLMTKQQVEKELEKHYDEEGNYKPPHPSTFPSMTRRDIMMNVRIPPLGIVPPPFGESQIKEINEKTTITKENIEWVRKHWTDESIAADAKNYEIIVEDILEMQKKGVSFESINLWLDYVSGADIGCPHAIYNRTWSRIDS